MSDFDFAIYLDGKEKKRLLDIQLELNAKLLQILKTDNLDLLILNSAFPDIKYRVIVIGEVIFQRQPHKVIVEPMIMNEYFDHQITLKQFGLTKSK